MPSLTRSALSGVAWNWGGMLVVVIVQIASTAATARLVSPHQFGLYAVGQGAGGIAGYFCLSTVAQGLQRRVKLGPDTIGSAYLICLVAGITVALIMVAAGSVIASVWGVEGAASVVRIFGIATFLQSGAVVPVALLRRDLRFRRAAAIETATTVLTISFSVAMAAAHHSAEAMAVGQAGGALLFLVVAQVATGKAPVLRYDAADGRELLTFSGQVSGIGLAAFLTASLPGIFIGRLFGADTLGLYSRAYMLCALPATYGSSGIYKVVYPLYGKLRDEPKRVRILLDEALVVATGIGWPAFGLLAGFAPIAVRVVLGPDWIPAEDLLPLCAAGVVAFIPVGLLTNFAEALGWMRILAVREVATGALVLVALSVGAALSVSVEGLLVGVAIATWAAYFIVIRPFFRADLLDVGRVSREQGIHGAFAVAAYLVALAVASAAANIPLVLQAALAALTGLAILALALNPRSPAGKIVRRRLLIARASPQAG
jgi:PST family polysaccharide transporter